MFRWRLTLALPMLSAQRGHNQNYQNADGSVSVPAALQPYLGGIQKLEA